MREQSPSAQLTSKQLKPYKSTEMAELRDYNRNKFDCLGMCRLRVTFCTTAVVWFGSPLGDEPCGDLGPVNRVYRTSPDVGTPSDAVDPLPDTTQMISVVLVYFPAHVISS